MHAVSRFEMHAKRIARLPISEEGKMEALARMRAFFLRKMGEGAGGRLGARLFGAATFLSVSLPGDFLVNASEFFGAALALGLSAKGISYLKLRAEKKKADMLMEEIARRVLAEGPAK